MVNQIACLKVTRNWKQVYPNEVYRRKLLVQNGNSVFSVNGHYSHLKIAFRKGWEIEILQTTEETKKEVLRIRYWQEPDRHEQNLPDRLSVPCQWLQATHKKHYRQRFSYLEVKMPAFHCAQVLQG